MYEKCLIASLLLVTLIVGVFGQSGPRPAPDRAIQQMITEVSAKRIEADIRKLVSFGTRNTLSDQNDPTRGVGAARDWIFADF